jgi:hypothetical protein
MKVSHQSAYVYRNGIGYDVSLPPRHTSARPPVELRYKSDQQHIELEPLLIDGVDRLIVHLVDLNRYICSPTLLAKIRMSSNPHLTHREMSCASSAVLRTTTFGATIPIIRISTIPLEEMVDDRQWEAVTKAGVQHVLWPTDSIDEQLVNQLNWVLNRNAPIPYDHFAVYDTVLDPNNYSISSVFENNVDKQMSPESIRKVIQEVQDRLTPLRKDFNALKDVFYYGLANPSTTITEYSIPAQLQYEYDGFSIQDVRKTYTTEDEHSQTPPPPPPTNRNGDDDDDDEPVSTNTPPVSTNTPGGGRGGDQQMF